MENLISHTKHEREPLARLVNLYNCVDTDWVVMGRVRPIPSA